MMLIFKNRLVVFPILVVLAISGCSQNAPVTPTATVTATPSPSSISDINTDAALISDLFYQDQIAAGKSMKELFDFQIANTYPGLVDTAVATTEFNNGFTRPTYGVPDLTTLRLDPNWIVPLDCASIDLGGPPKGTTYMVATENEDGPAQVHVTILDGKAYYYPNFCLD